MCVIESGVEQNVFNNLQWNGIGVRDCGVEQNGWNRMWFGTE
jgi:hypothetical protein